MNKTNNNKKKGGRRGGRRGARKGAIDSITPLPDSGFDSGSPENPSQEGEDQAFDIPELLGWKLQAKGSAIELIAVGIRQSITEKFRREAQSAINKALSDHDEYQKAWKEREDVIKEVVTHFKGQIPEGYTAKEFNPEDMTITYEIKPSEE